MTLETCATCRNIKWDDNHKGVSPTGSAATSEWRVLFTRFISEYLIELVRDNWNRACAILEANGMLERHATNAEWVRIKESEDG